MLLAAISEPVEVVSPHISEPIEETLPMRNAAPVLLMNQTHKTTQPAKTEEAQHHTTTIIVPAHHVAGVVHPTVTPVVVHHPAVVTNTVAPVTPVAPTTTEIPSVKMIGIGVLALVLVVGVIWLLTKGSEAETAYVPPVQKSLPTPPASDEQPDPAPAAKS